jgi:hypothetical protein
MLIEIHSFALLHKRQCATTNEMHRDHLFLVIKILQTKKHAIEDLYFNLHAFLYDKRILFSYFYCGANTNCFIQIN